MSICNERPCRCVMYLCSTVYVVGCFQLYLMCCMYVEKAESKGYNNMCKVMGVLTLHYVVRTLYTEMYSIMNRYYGDECRII